MLIRTTQSIFPSICPTISSLPASSAASSPTQPLPATSAASSSTQPPSPLPPTLPVPPSPSAEPATTPSSDPQILLPPSSSLLSKEVRKILINHATIASSLPENCSSAGLLTATLKDIGMSRASYYRNKSIWLLYCQDLAQFHTLLKSAENDNMTKVAEFIEICKMNIKK